MIDILLWIQRCMAKESGRTAYIVVREKFFSVRLEQMVGERICQAERGITLREYSMANFNIVLHHLEIAEK